MPPSAVGNMTPKQWLRLEVGLHGAEWSPETVYALTERLVELGSHGVQEAGDRCFTYFATPQDPPQFRARVERVIAQSIARPTFHWSVQPHEEWAELWRQGFEAHAIGDRLSVAPPWIAEETQSSRVLVIIDPGVAFGTAEHGSTRSCLTLLERHARDGDTILDVGAGSGVLAIAALKLGAATAVCVEVDAMACEALRENAERNQVLDQIQVICAPFGSSTVPGSFDTVVCNMVRGRLLPLLPQLVRQVAPGGRLLLGGLQDSERDAMLEELNSLGPGWGATEVCADDGWVAATLARDGLRSA